MWFAQGREPLIATVMRAGVLKRQGTHVRPLAELADLIAAGDVRVSEHGYDALADDGLGIDEILSGVPRAVVVEEYPDYPKGPAALRAAVGYRGQASACGMGHSSRLQ